MAVLKPAGSSPARAGVTTERDTHTHTRTRTRAHAGAHARTHARTLAHKHTCCQSGVSQQRRQRETQTYKWRKVAVVVRLE